MIRRLAVLLVLGISGMAVAEEPATNVHGADEHHAAAAQQPVLPDRSAWAGAVVIVILVGLFLPAAVIGPIARALAPEDEPVTHSHDEPPGASHHHGSSGTADPHDHGHGHGHH